MFVTLMKTIQRCTDFPDRIRVSPGFFSKENKKLFFLNQSSCQLLGYQYIGSTNRKKIKLSVTNRSNKLQFSPPPFILKLAGPSEARPLSEIYQKLTLKTLPNPQNFSRSAKIWQICQNLGKLPKFVKIAKILSNLPNFCQKCQNFVKIAKILSNFTKF